MTNDTTLDSLLIYEDGNHIETQHLERIQKGGIAETEENLIWHHVSECKECQQTVSNFIKSKKN